MFLVAMKMPYPERWRNGVQWIDPLGIRYTLRVADDDSWGVLRNGIYILAVGRYFTPDMQDLIAEHQNILKHLVHIASNKEATNRD